MDNTENIIKFTNLAKVFKDAGNDTAYNKCMDAISDLLKDDLRRLKFLDLEFMLLGNENNVDALIEQEWNEKYKRDELIIQAMPIDGVSYWIDGKIYKVDDKGKFIK